MNTTGSQRSEGRATRAPGVRAIARLSRQGGSPPGTARVPPAFPDKADAEDGLESHSVQGPRTPHRRVGRSGVGHDRAMSVLGSRGEDAI